MGRRAEPSIGTVGLGPEGGDLNHFGVDIRVASFVKGDDNPPCVSQLLREQKALVQGAGPAVSPQ